jgi:predicted metal-binding membrane protein
MMTLRPRPLFVFQLPSLALIVAGFAWALLLGSHASPYGRYVHPAGWDTTGLGAVICAVVPGGTWLAPLMAYAVGWLLMTAAMMLPTTLPLTRIFGRMVAGGGDSALLQSLLITGYLLAWACFGAAAFVLDQALHTSLSLWGWSARHPELLGVMVLSLAGGFQFSKLKYHCLDKCRSPLGFVTSHWHGPQPRREAFLLGLTHGAFCVGCCWALMLVMFFVGTANLGWMMALGLVMAVEKNHPWGRRLAAPLGVTLLALSCAIIVGVLV